jgi:hypothetical protein
MILGVPTTYSYETHNNTNLWTSECWLGPDLKPCQSPKNSTIPKPKQMDPRGYGSQV